MQGIRYCLQTDIQTERKKREIDSERERARKRERERERERESERDRATDIRTYINHILTVLPGRSRRRGGFCGKHRRPL